MLRLVEMISLSLENLKEYALIAVLLFYILRFFLTKVHSMQTYIFQI
jgi:hypothetical protein